METSAANLPTLREHPLRALLDFFSSIYSGIFWIAMIILYGALGSAVPQFRQFFELTEFQYFNHWLFLTLIILFCINLIVATLRRIRFNVRNLGVLSVHVGLLMLCVGSVLYFGHKIEGDIWLDAPKIRIVSMDRLHNDPANAVIGQLIAAKGKIWEQTIPMLGGRHRIEVLESRHRGLKTAAGVRLKVNTPNQTEKMVQLGFDNPDQKNSQITQISERLALMLSPASEAHVFYDDQTPALIVQAGPGNDEAVRFELPELPYYNEHFIDAAIGDGATDKLTPILDTQGRPVTSSRNRPLPLLERWRMPITLIKPDSVLNVDWPFTLEIDGYLPYAELRQTPHAGGAKISPIVQVELVRDAHHNRNWLISEMPSQSQWELDSRTSVEFRWIADRPAIPPAWTRPIHGRHYLEVHVKDKAVRMGYDVTAGQRIKVEGTDYTLRVEELRPSWPLMTPAFQGARTPIALVWVESPAGQFQRSVLHRYPQLNQDRDRSGKKIRDGGGLVDENIEISYTDASGDRFMIVAGNNLAPTVIHTAPGGRRSMRTLKVGKAFIPTDDGPELTLLTYLVRPRFEDTAVVIPKRNRRSLADVRRQQSAIRLHLRGMDDAWSRHIWVPFSQYNTLHDMTSATDVRDVPGVGTLRLIYGRATQPLPSSLCLEQLHTDYYPGRKQASGWTSYFRYSDPKTGNVRRGKVFLNNTFTIGDWTFFQSGAPSDGESWTILGVGNRRGILPMLFGCILITLGMIYAFCVKPILMQRRKKQFAAFSAQTGSKEKAAMSPSTPSTEHESPDQRNAPRSTPKRGEKIARLLFIAATLTAVVAAPLRANERAQVDRLWHRFPTGANDESINPAADLAAIQDQIDVETLGAMALLDQAGWRFTTVDSWSRKTMHTIYGSKTFYGLDPVIAAIELIFNTAAYRNEPVIYVKDKGILRDITKHPIEVSQAQRKEIYRLRRVSYDFITSEPVLKRLEEINTDMLKNKAMGRLGNAKYHYENIGLLFTVIPNPQGSKETPWSSIFSLQDPSLRAAAGLSDQQGEKVFTAFKQFAQAWVNRDVKEINAAIADLNEILPALSPPGIYPPLESRRAELSYRRLDLLWWAWLVYIFSFFISIFAVATRYRWARPTGLALLIAAMCLHGYDLLLRWQVLDRVPVANMYEAIVSSTLAGAILGLLLELFSRKRIYLLSASLLGFFALTLPILLPDKINNNLQTMMPILDDVMLRIHTVLIISSYAVITLAFGVANCYLFVSAFRDKTPLARGMIGAQAGTIAWLIAAKLGLFDETNVRFVLTSAAATIAAGAMLVVGLCSIIGGRAVAAGPAGSSLAVGSRHGDGIGELSASDFPIQGDILEEFDRSHRVLLYIAMVALFVGLVLGAIWADYSWGRPWGWDPKEVFALNTWLIYAILIHARFVTQRRALWTSVLSILGFAAMQFNWWVVNFYIVGLHSYA